MRSHACLEAFERMRGHVDQLRAKPPNEDEVARARAYTAGRRVLALEQTRAVAHYAARQALVWGEAVDPREAVHSIEAVTVEEVAAAAQALPENFALACIGPHDTADFV
jgi:predicted Zn-dependent peptidase